MPGPQLAREGEDVQGTTWPGRWLPRACIGVWCGLWLGLSAPPLLARPAEPVAYAALERSVAAAVHAQSIPAAKEFLRRFPNSPERHQVRFWLAEALYATQAYQDAVPMYGALLRQAPMFPHATTVLHHLGLSLLRARQYNGALAALARLLEQFPGVAERDRVVYHLATVYVQQGRFAAALPLYQQLLHLDVPPVPSPTLHFQLGHGYFYLQQFERAQQQYHLVLQDFPRANPRDRAQGEGAGCSDAGCGQYRRRGAHFARRDRNPEARVGIP